MQFDNNQPIYLQIADLLCTYIIQEKYKEGERIPSVREIGSMLEVNPNTALRAYNELQKQEIIHDKRGMGYYVSEHGKEYAAEYRKKQFIEEQLPLFFHNMKLLNIEISQIETLYNQYLKQHENENRH